MSWDGLIDPCDAPWEITVERGRWHWYATVQGQGLMGYSISPRFRWRTREGALAKAKAFCDKEDRKRKARENADRIEYGGAS